ncbi:UNVERIFIED_CONTAM: hypothetical protein Slati_1495200, partial [Sesamum latifolium]
INPVAPERVVTLSRLIPLPITTVPNHGNRISPSHAQASKGRNFRKNIRAYNHVFSFTYMGVALDENLPAFNQGIYTFRAHGLIYHRIGSLLPPPGVRPRYLQMFIYDTENELEHRLQESGVHYLTFKQPAEKHGLLEDDNSIRECLVEARSFRMPSALRRLFAIILLYCEPSGVRMLWEENYPHMIEDYPSSSFEDMRAISSVIEHELSIPILDDDLHGSRVLNTGGSGKTFLYRTLLANFRNDGYIILATATSDIAANLPPGGRTAHSKFKIPIKFEPMAMCRFIDRTFRDMLGVDLPFGGKVMILEGDFCQILPVVINGTKSQIIKVSIVESSLWSSVKVLNLSENMRAQHDPHFSDFLLRVDNGDEPTIENDMIRIPDSMAMHWEGENSIDELINAIFPDLSSHMYDTDYMENRAIITHLNDDVNKLNEKAINAFPGEEVTYYSFDSVPDDTRNLYLPEFLNSISPGNLPPHKLVLKKGSPIMLLRNIDLKIGLCNGTRLICRRFGRNLIEAEILAGQFKRMRVFFKDPIEECGRCKNAFRNASQTISNSLEFCIDN